ncbi:recombinase family protein [Erysipelothrix rhusiopathiae]|nr:recombinase family protein [Erysipelothrix rhusiopathiae]MDE8230116.1 recombinase family protein [Erysipelothrix rhusiopathiae]MDE8303590.1 recombinase family protein [Erysipelothrix rhusiopathiae]
MERKIAIYCRVSTDDQAENGYNLREQEKRIEQYISVYADDFTENTIKYIDDGYSAKDLNRREMKLLIEDINNGLISKIVIHNLDRLTRSMKDLIYLIELFEKKEVQLYSLKEKIDTKTAIGRFFVSMIILIAQWEREAISERTVRGLDQSSYEGNYVHGSPPFGYDLIDKKLVINSHESTIVEEAFMLYIYEDLSMNLISLMFREKYSNERYNWTQDRIRNIFNNPIYYGKYQNKRIEIENHSPAIVSKYIHDLANRKMRERRYKTKNSYKYNGKCVDTEGTKLSAKSTNKPNKTYLYYRNNLGKSINQDLIDNELGNYINKYISELRLATMKNSIMTLGRYDRKIAQVKKALDLGLISVNKFIEIRDEIHILIKNKETLIPNDILEITYWEEMDSKQRQLFIDKNIKRIVIDMNLKKIVKVRMYDIDLN